MIFIITVDDQGKRSCERVSAVERDDLESRCRRIRLDGFSIERVIDLAEVESISVECKETLELFDRLCRLKTMPFDDDDNVDHEYPETLLERIVLLAYEVGQTPPKEILPPFGRDGKVHLKSK